MAVLVIAEHDNNQIKDSTLNTITAAQVISGGEVDLLCVGNECKEVAENASNFKGVATVKYADSPSYKSWLAEPVAALVVSLSGNYTHIVAPHTTMGRNIAPRVAALLDQIQVSDIIDVKDPKTYVRPIYAGNALATVQTDDERMVVTVRTTAFEKAQSDGGNANIEELNAVDDPGISNFIGQELTKSERPELTSARVVVSGGRGMQSGDNFPLVEAVADRLGAAVGASRAAVDAGYVPNDYQVGQTGKVIAPELYLAVGISGAIQHLAGMKDSKVIAAINKDEEAPIFQIADYGLVGDLFELMPHLAEELDKQAIKPR
ncbi:MAG: electron transfer flavoprotein subunit alpha [Rhodospirillaceae bacterium]|nr:electron transfer flavoprotein subunit alpha [Rhodospirillaceae bacterium]|tara:strand:+ start:1500 stop:2456 length:957 start_codon:yes stop_codon:yes gene_type:complete